MALMGKAAKRHSVLSEKHRSQERRGHGVGCDWTVRTVPVSNSGVVSAFSVRGDELAV